MSDHYELEVRLALSMFDDHVKRFGKGLDSVSIKVRCRLIKSNNLQGYQHDLP